MTTTAKPRRNPEITTSMNMDSIHCVQAVIDGLGPSIFVGLVDTDGRVLRANQASFDAIGAKPEEVIGRAFAATPWWRFSHESEEQLQLAFASAADGEPSCFEQPFHDYDGNLRFLQFSLVPLLEANGNVRCIVLSAQDITACRASEDALSKTQFAVDKAAGAIFQSGQDGLVHYANEAAARMLGYTREALIGLPIHAIDPAVTRERWSEAWMELKAKGALQFESENIRADGSRLPVNVSVTYFEYAEMECSFAYVEDISARKAAEQHARYVAQHDRLTELPNRSNLCENLGSMLAFADRAGRKVCLLLIGVDRFRRVNELLGQAGGDDMLQQVARRLRENAGERTFVARSGGDEFAVLLPYDEVSETERIAERLRSAFLEPFEIHQQEIFSSISIGVATYPDDGDNVEDLVKAATHARTFAKQLGGNEVARHRREHVWRDPDRLTLEAALRRALERDELRVHYQPRVTVDDDCISGVEALARWEHPELGFVPPGRFIPLAEETGLILPIGEWILREACRQGAAWKASGLEVERIGVNLSARQFRRPGLVENVAAVLDETGMPARMLELEITESMLMEDVDAAIETLNALKALGVLIALDDFGTGYSSLSYLKRLPIDTLKIDRSFVNEISTDPVSIAIAEAIIVMAHNLKLTVIAEGVETEAQREALKLRGCDQLQGYLFSRPLPEAEVTGMLAERLLD